jgi:hypothetical protein
MGDLHRSSLKTAFAVKMPGGPLSYGKADISGSSNGWVPV